MIQRIQTIYLLIVSILLIVMMLIPVGHFYTETNVAEMTNLAIITANGTADYTPWALFVLLLLSTILAFAAIFLYKKRMLQIRLTVFSTIILIGYYITCAVFAVSTLSTYGSFTPSWSICLPFISIILNWLAIRAIRKDEALVRSYNTIR